jgi:hypothetical protein
MCASERFCQAVFSVRRKQEMNVVSHQAISGEPHDVPAAVRREQLQIGGAIRVFVENRFSAISSLGHMMPATGNDHSGDSSHERI